MIILSSSVHDPHAGLLWRTEKCLKTIQTFFDDMIVVASPLTDDRLLNYLKDHACPVEQRKDNVIGKIYFRSFEQAMKQNYDYIFYCDFDRILHWVERYPDELRRLVKSIQTPRGKSRRDYIVCERTSRAYETHHEALYKSEQVANTILSQTLGEKRQHDYLSGAYIVSQKAARLVSRYGPYQGIEHMAVWPLILRKNKIDITYCSFEGLEWETPYQYRDAVRQAGGISRWRKDLSTLEEWKRRVGHVEQIIHGIELVT